VTQPLERDADPQHAESNADPDEPAATDEATDGSADEQESPEAPAQPARQGPNVRRHLALGEESAEPAPVAVQQHAADHERAQGSQSDAPDAAVETQSAIDAVSEIAAPAKTQAADDAADLHDATDALGATLSQTTSAGQSTFGSALKTAQGRDASAASPSTAPPEQHFAADNHPRILSGIHGQLLPGGGTMHLKLDPPELGALQVSVHMQDGVMTASFQTSNDDATRLLSHSLTQLKHALEQQGVSVEKLHVTQAPRDSNSSFDDQRSGQQHPGEQSAAQQEQQRREMLRRMWRRLTNGSDPLDLVA
jgi:flagellar hook-length control protein FliK